MRGILLTVVLTVVVTSAPALAPNVAAKEPDNAFISIKTLAFVVENAKDGDRGDENRKPMPDKVTPGTVVEYEITGKNDSEKTVIDLPTVGAVPEHTHYVEDSARLSVDGVIQYSYDGGETFSAPPVTRSETQKGGGKRRILVLPEDYTHVRFMVDQLGPGDEYVGTYRVRVE